MPSKVWFALYFSRALEADYPIWAELLRTMTRWSEYCWRYLQRRLEQERYELVFQAGTIIQYRCSTTGGTIELEKEVLQQPTDYVATFMPDTFLAANGHVMFRSSALMVALDFRTNECTSFTDAAGSFRSIKDRWIKFSEPFKAIDHFIHGLIRAKVNFLRYALEKK